MVQVLRGFGETGTGPGAGFGDEGTSTNTGTQTSPSTGEGQGEGQGKGEGEGMENVFDVNELIKEVADSNTNTTDIKVTQGNKTTTVKADNKGGATVTEKRDHSAESLQEQAAEEAFMRDAAIIQAEEQDLMDRQDAAQQQAIWENEQNLLAEQSDADEAAYQNNENVFNNVNPLIGTNNTEDHNSSRQSDGMANASPRTEADAARELLQDSGESR